MSLNHVKSMQTDIKVTGWSIAKRLAWFYTLSSSLLLIVACGFLYWILNTTLEKEDENFLNNRAGELRAILQDQPEDTKTLEREVRNENLEPTGFQSRTYSRILDEQGRVLYETPGMKNEIPLTLFAEHTLPINTLKNWESSSSGKTFRMVVTYAETKISPNARYQIQVAMDESSEAALMKRYGSFLAGVLVLGILCSAVIGIVAARHSMRPLKEITRAAEKVSANQLHERMNTTQWPQELVLLATAFDGMLDRLEESFSRLSQFSADLAHELRTPINNLRGEAEVALSKPRDAQVYREIISSSLEEYERLSRMSDNLLFLAKTENTQTVIHLTVTQAGEEIAKIIEFYDLLADERGVKVSLEGDAKLQVDTVLFRRLISNLLANALQYTPCGGVIQFSIVQSTDAMTLITCRDTGIGIAQEHLPKIFDRFYRVDPSRQAHTEGAGLGLAIVQSIMRLHGGEVAINSVVGEGTSFILSFPPL